MNIEGVDVLYTEEILTTSEFWRWLFLLLIISLIVSLFLGLYFEKIFLLCISSVLVFAMLASSMMLICGVFDKSTNRYRYECTISEGASFEEITQKYELVETRGKIYILEDKEDDD